MKSTATFVIKRSTMTDDLDGEFVEGTAALLGRLMELSEMPRRDCLDVVYKARPGTDVLAVAQHGSQARALFGGAFFVVKQVQPAPEEHHRWCSCEQCW